MKKLFTILMVAAAVTVGTTSFAQTTGKASNTDLRFGIGLEGALPMGALKFYDIGAGLSLRLSKGFTDQITGTASAGATAFFPTGNLTGASKASIYIPVKVGGKYFITENFYGSAELGLTLTKTYTVTGFSGTTPTYGFANGTSFTYAPGIGVQFGSFDLSARYEGLDGGGFLGLRLGFDF